MSTRVKRQQAKETVPRRLKKYRSTIVEDPSLPLPAPPDVILSGIVVAADSVQPRPTSTKAKEVRKQCVTWQDKAKRQPELWPRFIAFRQKWDERLKKKSEASIADEVKVDDSADRAELIKNAVEAQRSVERKDADDAHAEVLRSSALCNEIMVILQGQGIIETPSMEGSQECWLGPQMTKTNRPRVSFGQNLSILLAHVAYSTKGPWQQVRSWDVSHLCSESRCVRPDHIVVEQEMVNHSRKNCLKHGYISNKEGVVKHMWYCSHEPPCFKLHQEHPTWDMERVKAEADWHIVPVSIETDEDSEQSTQPVSSYTVGCAVPVSVASDEE